MKRWMYFAGLLGIGIIIPLVGMGILENFFEPSVVNWFLLIYVAIIWIGGYSLTRRSSSKIEYEILPPTSPLPEDLQPFHEELLSLGFQLNSEIRIKHFFKKKQQWAYFNEDHSISAYTHNFTWARVWFSSYFEDGFDVTTYHEHGDNLETKKLIKRVVKTDISSALDYHTHHIGQHANNHGNIIKFADLKQQIEWEKQQQYGREHSKQYLTTIGRSIAALVISIIINAILSFAIKISTSELLASIEGFASLLVIIICFAWALRPTLWPETVESRKKRKAKDLESVAVAQEEIYPF